MFQPGEYPSAALRDAVEAIGSLPGVGSRSALRLALHLLKKDPGSILDFTAAISRLATDVHYCSICNMICDGDDDGSGICPICADRTRNHSQICVVESIRDVMSIEATGQYRGVYHVLGGKISPIEGIAPSDLTISQLVQRLNNAVRLRLSNIEVILALSGDVEGETTAFYIYRQLEGMGITVSTLARGLGFGEDLEYADSLTLGRSIASRQPFNP